MAINRYDVASQDRSVSPCRSPTIVGSAVATTVVSSEERALPIMSPMNTTQMRRVFSVPHSPVVVSCTRSPSEGRDRRG